jgi:hypothetical protein
MHIMTIFLPGYVIRVVPTLGGINRVVYVCMCFCQSEQTGEVPVSPAK